MATSMISDGVHPVVLQLDRRGVDAGHVEEIAEQPREAIELVWARRACSWRPSSGSAVFWRLLTAMRMAVSGVRDVVDRGEQRRREVGALPDQLRLFALAEQLGAFDGHRREPGHRVERARDRARSAPTARSPIARVPKRSGTSRTSRPRASIARPWPA